MAQNRRKGVIPGRVRNPVSVNGYATDNRGAPQWALFICRFLGNTGMALEKHARIQQYAREDHVRDQQDHPDVPSALETEQARKLLACYYVE